MKEPKSQEVRANSSASLHTSLIQPTPEDHRHRLPAPVHSKFNSIAFAIRGHKLPKNSRATRIKAKDKDKGGACQMPEPSHFSLPQAPAHTRRYAVVRRPRDDTAAASTRRCRSPTGGLP